MSKRKLEKYENKINKIINILKTCNTNLLGGAGSFPPGLVYPQEPTCSISTSSTKIIKTHGALTGKQFSLREGTNIITLVAVGDTCPFSELIETHITLFYESGKTLFTENDTTNVLTDDAKLFIERFDSSRLTFGIDEMTGDRLKFRDRYVIRNHVGTVEGLLVNDSVLSFTGPHCNDVSCSINCINRDSVGIITSTRNVKPMWYGNKETTDGAGRPTEKLMHYPINNVLLSDLIYKEGQGTYILFSCRSFIPGVPAVAVRSMRQTSDLETDGRK
jgi:hypothetical protein